MAALRRGNAKIAESRLHNHARAGDFIPFDRNAQPGFSRSPASHPNQKIGPVLLIEQAIEPRDRRGYFLAARALEALRIDHYDIAQIVDAAVAQNFAALADQLLRPHRSEERPVGKERRREWSG